jgi:hypothetical protein
MSGPAYESYRGRDLWWRQTARRPAILGLDAGVLAPLVFVLVHPRAWTLYIVLVVIAALIVLWFMRITPREAMRAVGVVVRTVGMRRGLVARDRRGRFWR